MSEEVLLGAAVRIVVVYGSAYLAYRGLRYLAERRLGRALRGGRWVLGVGVLGGAVTLMSHLEHLTSVSSTLMTLGLVATVASLYMLVGLAVLGVVVGVRRTRRGADS